jgi:hypothetical protein
LPKITGDNLGKYRLSGRISEGSLDNSAEVEGLSVYKEVASVIVIESVYVKSVEANPYQGIFDKSIVQEVQCCSNQSRGRRLVSIREIVEL